MFPELYAKAEFRTGDDVTLLGFEDWSEQREVGLYWREGSGRERHYQAIVDAADLVAVALKLR